MISVVDDLPSTSRNRRCSGDPNDVTQTNLFETGKIKKFCVAAVSVLVVTVCAIALLSVDSNSDNKAANASEPLSDENSCRRGFVSIDQRCIDIDECHVHENACAQSLLCTNTVGSYTCDCRIGYGIS